MQRYRCHCLFDITQTGITGHLKIAQLPFKTRTGQIITNAESWHRARNKQRNWETITQILSLRTQIFEIESPSLNNNIWTFSFAVEATDVYLKDNNPFGLLLDDCEGVPLIANLDEVPQEATYLIVAGQNRNIWFETVNTLLN